MSGGAARCGLRCRSWPAKSHTQSAPTPCRLPAGDPLQEETAASSQHILTEEVRREEGERGGVNKPPPRPEFCQSGGPQMMLSQSDRDDWPQRTVGANGTIPLLTSQPTSKPFTELSIGLLISSSHPPQP